MRKQVILLVFVLVCCAGFILGLNVGHLLNE